MMFRVKLRVKRWKTATTYPVGPAVIPAFPKINQPPTQSKCSKCGLVFSDALGRPIALGLVCTSIGCPSGLGGATCIVSSPPSATAAIN